MSVIINKNGYQLEFDNNDQITEYVEQDVIQESRGTMSIEDFDEFIEVYVEGQLGWWFDADLSELIHYIEAT